MLQKNVFSHKLSFLILFVFVFLSSPDARAQEVRKEVETVKEGGAPQMKIIKVEKDDSGMNTTEDESLEINIENKNGEGKKEYKLTTLKDGVKKVIIWDGNGEMPSEIASKLEGDGKREMTKRIRIEKQRSSEDEAFDMPDMDSDEEHSITINVDTDDHGGQKEYIITKVVDGKKEVMRWTGDESTPDIIGQDMEDVKILEGRPGEMKVIVRTDKDNVDEKIGNTKRFHKEIRKEFTPMEDHFKPKVSLGVMIEDEGNGVTIQDVKDQSPASAAGIKRGDTIVKINSAYIFSTKSLMDNLSLFDPGDKVNIIVLRAGKDKKLKVKF